MRKPLLHTATYRLLLFRFALLHHIINQSQAACVFAALLFDQSPNRFQLHLHCEGASFAKTRWGNFNFTVCRLNYLLHNGKAQTQSLTVDLSCALKLSKTSEKFVHVFWGYANTSVLDLESQDVFWPCLIVRRNLYFSLRREFHRVLDKVHQHLFYASHVSQKRGNLLLGLRTSVLDQDVFSLGLWSKDLNDAFNDLDNVYRLACQRENSITKLSQVKKVFNEHE